MRSTTAAAAGGGGDEKESGSSKGECCTVSVTREERTNGEGSDETEGGEGSDDGLAMAHNTCTAVLFIV